MKTSINNLSCRFSKEADKMVIELAKAHNTQRWIIYSLLAEYAIANMEDFENSFPQLYIKVANAKRPIAAIMQLTPDVRSAIGELAKKQNKAMAHFAFCAVLYGLDNETDFRKYIRNNPLPLL